MNPIELKSAPFTRQDIEIATGVMAELVKQKREFPGETLVIKLIREEYLESLSQVATLACILDIYAETEGIKVQFSEHDGDTIHIQFFENNPHFN